MKPTFTKSISFFFICSTFTACFAQKNSNLTANDWGSVASHCAAYYNVFGQVLESKGDRSNAAFFKDEADNALKLGYRFIGDKKTIELWSATLRSIHGNTQKYGPILESESVKCFGHIKAAEQRLGIRRD